MIHTDVIFEKMNKQKTKKRLPSQIDQYIFLYNGYSICTENVISSKTRKRFEV